MIKNWTFIKIVTHRSKKINKIKLNKMQKTEQRDIIITDYEKKKKERSLESSQEKKKKTHIIYRGTKSVYPPFFRNYKLYKTFGMSKEKEKSAYMK